MDKITAKLAHAVGDAKLAAKLVAAGLKYPTKIGKASNAQLASAGLDGDEIDAVRQKLPKR